MTSAPLPLPARPRASPAVIATTLVLAGLLVWSVLGLGITGRRLGDLPRELARLAAVMWPPDWAYARQRGVGAVIESVQIAWVGTLIGAILSLPLGLLAARNMSGAGGAATKVVLAAIRSVPELLLAIFFVPILGLGAFAGTLAIGVHSVGTLGKLTSEVVESIDTSPIEAVTAAGGTRSTVFRYAVLPQVLPEVIAYWLYRFEINLRASVVLGVVGAGGVGGVLLNTLRYRRFDKAGAVLALTVAVVFVIDSLSAALRARIVTGEGGRSRISRIASRLRRSSEPMPLGQ